MTDSVFDAARFAARLRLAQRSRRLTQQEAAAEADVNQATLSIALRGGGVSVNSLFKLCAWLGVPVDEFRTNGRGE